MVTKVDKWDTIMTEAHKILLKHIENYAPIAQSQYSNTSPEP